MPTRSSLAYRASFRYHVQMLIAMGYQRLGERALRDMDEPSITGKLVCAMRDAMAADDAPRWVAKYSLRDDPPVDVPGKHGRDRPRVDIEVERVQRGPRPCYHWEAKRLRDRSSMGAYLGREGLGCYLRAAYARWSEEVGMLGYVEVDDEAAWAARFDQRLQEDPKRFCVLKNGAWTHARVVPQLEHSYRTEHSRGRGRRSITVYHVLLRFC